MPMHAITLKSVILPTSRLLRADVRQRADMPVARWGRISLLVIDPISASAAGTRHWGGAVTGGHVIGTCLPAG